MEQYALDKRQQDYVRSMVGSKLAAKMIGLGLRLLSAEIVEERTPTRLMFWPFDYSKAKVKTWYGKVDRETIFQMMRDIPSNPFTKVSSKAFKGTAKCRCCGESVGAADEIDSKGVIRPSGVDHYKQKHCINLNLVDRTITDPETKLMWRVVYIGSIGALGTK